MKTIIFSLTTLIVLVAFQNCAPSKFSAAVLTNAEGNVSHISSIDPAPPITTPIAIPAATTIPSTLKTPAATPATPNAAVNFTLTISNGPNTCQTGPCVCLAKWVDFPDNQGSLMSDSYAPSEIERCADLALAQKMDVKSDGSYNHRINIYLVPLTTVPSGLSLTTLQYIMNNFSPVRTYR